MRLSQRKTGTKVRNGKVSRKNRTELSNHYSQVSQLEPVIDRRRPGAGYRHYLTINDVRRFIRLLPDWDELAVGLNAVILSERTDCLGWHKPGLIAVCAWEREPVQDWDREFVEEHASVLARLGVSYEPIPGKPDGLLCGFDEASVKGFLLMHILLHELGHHHDRMTTRSRRNTARGESYAEEYALKYADRLWDDYFTEFNW